MEIPFYAIAASVSSGNRIVRFHGAGEEIFWDIPRLRHMGFDVSIPAAPQRGPDESLELRSGDRKLLRLYQDGSLLFRARADHEFLGWGVEPAKFSLFPKLNPVAVVEVHASFVQLYRRVIENLKKPVQEVSFRLSLVNGVWGGGRLFLTPYFPSGSVDWGAVTRYKLQEDPAEAQITVTREGVMEAPARVAYQLLEEFASWFDMDSEDIPFVRDVDGTREIDIDAIVAL